VGVSVGPGVVVSQAQKMEKKGKKKDILFCIFWLLWWPISSLAASVYSLGDA
jgi:hypothetical protein